MAPAAKRASPKKKKRPRKASGYSESPQHPFFKVANQVPGLIQVENFDRGGEGAAYHDGSSGNDGGTYRRAESVDIKLAADFGGGYFVSHAQKGEWTEYTVNIAAAGCYNFTARVAALGVGGRFHIEVDRVRKTPSLTIPATGGWQNWTTLSVPGIYLPAGIHVVRLGMDATGYKGVVGNFNWIGFTMVPPAAPVRLIATAPSAFGVQLNWGSSGWNETVLKLERKVGPYGVWTQIATLDPDTPGYWDDGVAPGTQYFYRMKGWNPGGDSAYTPAVAVSTLPADRLVITRGGVYSGCFQSLNPNYAAIVVATNEPVVIQNAVIRSRSDIIATATSAANLTVRNVIGLSLNPNVLGRQPGRFLDVEGFDNVRVENCYMEGTTGIYLYNYRGNRTANQTVKVLRNSARNINGRLSNGSGGFLGKGGPYVQFLQLNGVQDLPGVEIAWNQVINDPGASLVEDNISIHGSSGTSSSPILIHDNYIQGAYPVDPAGDSNYSGGGIMLSDNGSSWVWAYRNQVVSTSNYGIAISSGHDNGFSNNRIVSSGRLRNGDYIASQNVGAYIWDADKSGSGFYNNGGSNNVIGWWRRDMRNDWWLRDASSWDGNDHWPDAVTIATEADEYKYWLRKLDNSGVHVGPL